MLFALDVSGPAWGTVAALLALIGTIYSETSKRVRAKRNQSQRRANEPDLAMDRLLRFIDELQEQADGDRRRLREVEQDLEEQRHLTRSALKNNAELEHQLRVMTARVEELEMRNDGQP